LLAIAYPTGCRYSTVPIPRNVPVGQQWREARREAACPDAGKIAQKPARRACCTARRLAAARTSRQTRIDVPPLTYRIGAPH